MAFDCNKAMFKKLFSKSNTLSVNDQPLTPTAFRRLLMFAIGCFIAIWIIETTEFTLARFDAFAYPICISCFAVALILSWLQLVPEAHLHLFCYTVIAMDLIVTSVLHHLNPYGHFGDTSQWLGLNYAMAYLFLELRKAIWVMTVMFVITLVGHYWAMSQHATLQQTYSVLLELGVSHVVYIVLLGTVVTIRVDKAKAQARADILEHEALTDPLTGILNRRGMQKKFENYAFHQQNSDYSLLIIDVDHFKRLNDNYGHLVGDQALVSLVELLIMQIRSDDILSRWGGEEFVILTFGYRRSQVLEFAERLRQSIAQMKIAGGHTITASIGVSHSYEADSRREMLHLADMNLYKAKQYGRNRVVDCVIAQQLTTEGNSVAD
ncbi:GGDEF domain-containing protein [Celerinatantimonas yamalensis]|uniref:diguanylate cyclase n=1 Tax=Celerinatantimonas yamalensis TaxID=559956 RepID=A0ABW9G9Z8_9GAMM